MTVSPGNLDSLLNQSFPATDLSSVSFQSAITSNPPAGFGYSSVNFTTTGEAPFTSSGEIIKVVGVNDANNSVTLNFSQNGQTLLQQSFVVVGYDSSGLLLFSGPSASIFSTTLGIAPSVLNPFTFVLSSSPLASGTSLSFTPNGSTPLPVPTPGLSVFDTTTNQPVVAVAQPYTGPVNGLQEQYINITNDSLNISASTPNWFIHSGSGNDAIAVSGGINVLDGGTGSNFLTSGTGTDTFFVDDRTATSDIWSTVSNFHANDAVTIWRITPQNFQLNYADNQGAVGFTGLTVHAIAAGKPIASLTLAGYSTADLNNGRLSVSFGTDPASGSSYMYIHGNS